jgi:hypothetical protein
VGAWGLGVWRKRVLGAVEGCAEGLRRSAPAAGGDGGELCGGRGPARGRPPARAVGVAVAGAEALPDGVEYPGRKKPLLAGCGLIARC